MKNYIRQTKILTERYFRIFFNNKRNLSLKIIIPLATILIVCLVACPDMFSVVPDKNHEINKNYPVLVWEKVAQEAEPEDDGDENELIKAEKSTKKKWSGNYDKAVAPSVYTKKDDENYLLITDPNQLAFLSKAIDLKMEKYLTYNYILQCDINMDNKKFIPIGDAKHPFTGTFDGSGHIISNLKIDRKSGNTGLFAYVKSNSSASKKVKIGDENLTFYHNGMIHSLGVENVKIESTSNNTAIFIGKMDSKSRLYSVYAKKGSVTSSGKNTGSLVGAVAGNNAEIYMCYTSVDVKGKNSTGGLVGNLGNSRLSGCYFNGKVKDSSSDDIGAVIGNCDDEEKNVKNVFYNSDKVSKIKAISDKDYEKVAYGMTEKELKNAASLLVPFKDIMSSYDFAHLEGSHKDDYEDDGYDPEKDKDIDNEYGFKKDGQLSRFEKTQTGIFMLVCVAIFTGICNSITEICKERNILKREYMTNLSLPAYISSKMILQGLLCAVQMLIVVFITALFLNIQGRNIPASGVFFDFIWIEVFATMFLLAFAADTISMFISSVVKSPELANTFIPVILIVQIVFAGVLFDFSGFMDTMSNVMISKWGTGALAAIIHLNDAQGNFMIKNPDFSLQLGSSMSVVKDVYASSAGTLLLSWGVLVAFIVVSSIASCFVLKNVKNDRR